MNAHYGAVPFRLPGADLGKRWHALFAPSESLPYPEAAQPVFRADEIYPLQGRALAVLIHADPFASCPIEKD
jgi:hypothetical protein